MTTLESGRAAADPDDWRARGAAQLWQERELKPYLSPRATASTAGTFTDWGLGGLQVQMKAPPISLAGGMPDAGTQPRDDLIAAMRRALDTEDDSPLVYGGPLGYEPLREAIGRYEGREEATPPGADRFILVNGAAGAIDAVCSVFLEPGDVVISEVPTFAGSLRTLHGYQAEVVGVAMDGEGIRLDKLEETITLLEQEGRRIKLLYTIPTFHNPTGVTSSLQHRLDLLALMAEHGIYVLEDTAYAELYFGDQRPAPLSSLTDGHGVLTAGTFSKVIATGLRVGWVQARPEVIEAMVPARFDMGNSPMLHRMLYQYMVNGPFEEHVEEMRALYQRKVETLASALRDYGEPYFDFRMPQGGFFLWLRLRPGLDAAAVQKAAYEEGVICPAGSRFYPDGDCGEDGECIRLAYSWTALENLEEAAARLVRGCEAAAGA